MGEGSQQGGGSAGAFQGELFELPLGERLKMARTEQKLELESVAYQLKLEASVLSAIEEGEGPPHGLPEVFYQGFVRNYARMLGVEIDPGEVRKSSQAEVARENRRGSSRSSRSPRESITTQLQGSVMPAVERIQTMLGRADGGWVQWLKENPLIPAVVLLLVIVMFSMFSGDEAVKTIEQEVVVAEQADGIEAAQDVVAESQQEEQSEAEAKAATSEGKSDAAAETPVDAMAVPRGKVTLRYVDGSWTQVRDGMDRVLVKRMLDAGTIEHFEGPLPIEVKLGNAIGVRVQFNEEPFDHLNYIEDNNTAEFVLGAAE